MTIDFSRMEVLGDLIGEIKLKDGNKKSNWSTFRRECKNGDNNFEKFSVEEN